MPRLETVKIVLVHYNLVNNIYQQASKVLFTFLPSNQFGQLITITPHSLTMLKTSNAEFSFFDKYGKKLMNTATKAGINVAKKFGDKYGRNLMNTAKKTRN